MHRHELNAMYSFSMFGEIYYDERTLDVREDIEKKINCCRLVYMFGSGVMNYYLI